jgi:hypothetical protein
MNNDVVAKRLRAHSALARPFTPTCLVDSTMSWSKSAVLLALSLAVAACAGSAVVTSGPTGSPSPTVNAPSPSPTATPTTTLLPAPTATPTPTLEPMSAVTSAPKAKVATTLLTSTEKALYALYKSHPDLEQVVPRSNLEQQVTLCEHPPTTDKAAQIVLCVFLIEQDYTIYYYSGVADALNAAIVAYNYTLGLGVPKTSLDGLLAKFTP